MSETLRLIRKNKVSGGAIPLAWSSITPASKPINAQERHMQQYQKAGQKEGEKVAVLVSTDLASRLERLTKQRGIPLEELLNAAVTVFPDAQQVRDEVASHPGRLPHHPKPEDAAPIEPRERGGFDAYSTDELFMGFPGDD